ncbi:unnamed protein product [Leuciscus chuanchicus]
MVACSNESCFLLHHVDGRVHVHCLPGEVVKSGCTVGRGQADGESVMLWAMFCWETLGPAIHMDVNLTCATYLNIVADQHGMIYWDCACLFNDYLLSSKADKCNELNQPPSDGLASGRMEEDWCAGLISEILGYEAVELVLFQSGQVPGVSPPHLSTPLFLPVLFLHSTKGLIFCMIRPPPVLLLAPGPRLSSEHTVN